ncbi:MAG TPA: tetratricopeptide repeat protein [Bryobacteraceae bacterium]|nr:tetratricopeptide repeat protein [Bryobacteraceae bacterium]
MKLLSVACLAVLWGVAPAGGRSAPGTSKDAAPILIDFPEAQSIFPPDIAPPTFLWRESAGGAIAWRVEIVFAGRGAKVKEKSTGEKPQIGEVDTTLVGYVPPTLTPEQEAQHTWKPAPKLWEEIKKHSQKHTATLVITGFRDERMTQPVSTGRTTFTTSADPVGAPIFYRDVPLIPPDPSERERGIIHPLSDSVLPKIKWRLRYVNETSARTVMEGLPTCANCHSVSRDGKTLGIDVDGPQNDKGLYGLIPVQKISSISNQYVIHWSAYTDTGSPKRFGFMSQVSPSGRYVVTSIDVPGSKGVRMMDRIYQGLYDFWGFGQVFYPTRGVLAWYDRETQKLQPLAGADDPEYVQTCAFWSPDESFIVFARAKARDPYPPGHPESKFANDPNETQIQYDLYRIPFNAGKGGKAEKIAGASENGMSNNFPKVSPDGKWIVWVQNQNGLLMRPDSKLYIVPSAGGEPRPLRSNLKTMNSWHSFSPNGRWLVFSSKTPTPYTKLYLTHIDEDGSSSPAIPIEAATAANRAVNIPEFINLGPDGLERIDAPATDFYKEFNTAADLSEKRQFTDALPVWQKAAGLNPDDPRVHNNLGLALAETGHPDDALAEYHKSLELNGQSSSAHNNLGSLLAQQGKIDEALAEFQKAVELNPANGRAECNLGSALSEKGRPDEALEHLRKGVEIDPKNADGQNNLGAALARAGGLDEAIEHISKAVEMAPQEAEYRYNFGRVLAAKGRFADAAAQFEQAASLTGGRQPEILDILAAMYAETGRYQDAVTTAQKALDLASQQRNYELASSLRASLARYQALAR